MPQGKLTLTYFFLLFQILTPSWTKTEGNRVALLVGWCRPHPSPDTGSGSHPPVPAPTPNRPDHRSSSSPASTGFSQSAPGAKSVWTCEQLNKCCVLCVWHWHSGHNGVGCVSGVILCKYSCSNGHLFVRSCASTLLV